MSGTTGIVAFVVALLVMVVVHEFGHFIAAKSFGIKVEEFFVGFGPRLFSRRRGETEYGVKAILLGGYVRIAGMNPWQTVPESDRPRTYGAKPAWQRAILLAAGSATHFVLATLVLAVFFATVGVPSEATTVLDSVTQRVGDAEGPARAAGLRPGDRIVAIDGRPTRTWEDVREAIRSRAETPISIEVERDGRRLQLTATPARTTIEDESGAEQTVGFLGVSPQLEYRRQSPPVALWSGMRLTGQLAAASVRGLGTIFSPEGIGRIFGSLAQDGARSVEEPIGLVGGARLAGQAAAAGEAEALVLFLAGFVVFVGVINLAPLPPLDGGHLLVLAIEKLSGRQIDMRKVVPVAALVVSLFVALTVALLYLDIIRPVQNPFQ